MKGLTLACTLLASAACAEDLRIATGGHYPPYIFQPATPQATGMDKDVLDEICDRGGFTCTWVDLPMSDIFQALARGDVDVVAGGFGYSPERDAIVDFTCPHVLGGENAGDFVGTRPDVDLIDARIGALDQSVYLTAMQQAQRDVRAFATEAEALNALQRGEIDLVFGSHNMTTMALAREGYYKLGEYPTFSGGTVFGVAENAPDLRATLNQLLEEISADGTLGRFEERWLGANSGDVISRCYDSTGLT